MQEQTKQGIRQTLRAVGRVLITIGALGVGVLTMPVWPFLVAAMVWNDFDAED